ncbi:MAG: hypothetical protein K5876_02030 [Ruminiclostridium sp.]|nr:hypothetical protein [Ruminiclostridium sp.]
MKKGSFSGLLYREFYLSRKSYITGLIMFAATAVFGWLILMSFHYGNLAKMIDVVAGENADPSAFDFDGIKQKMTDTVYLLMKGMPGLMAMTFLFSGTDIAGKDEVSIWQRFAKCTPVTPALRAFVKMLMTLIASSLSVGLAVGYILFIDLLAGTPLTYTELACVVTAAAAVTVLSVVAQIYIRAFRGMDKGMLALIVTVIVTEVTIMVINSPSKKTNDQAELDLAALCEQVFPFTPLIFAGAFAAGFAVLYIMYRRREK